MDSFPAGTTKGLHRVNSDMPHGNQMREDSIMQRTTVDVTRWCSEAGQLMHLDYQYYAGDSHQFLVGIAHGLTLLASSLAPCWGDRESWDEWLLMELRHRYLALCGLAVHLHAVHASTWMRAMTQGAPTWWQHQRDRLAA